MTLSLNTAFGSLYVFHDTGEKITDLIPAQAFLDKAENRVELVNRMASRSMYLYRSTLLKLAYKAIADGKSEVELEDMGYDREGFKMNLALLVDKEASICYGLKVDLATNSSKATNYFVLPIPPSDD